MLSCLFLLLFVLVFSAEGGMFLSFEKELLSPPLSTATLADLADDLAVPQKNVLQQLKVSPALNAYIDNRVDYLSALLEKTKNVSLDAEEKHDIETITSLLGYYRNYKVTATDLAPLKNPSPTSLPTPPYTIEDYKTLRLAIHKTFTDIEGQYILTLQSKTTCERSLQEIQATRAHSDKSTSPQANLLTELQEIDFASDVLDFQVQLDELHYSLTTLEQQKVALGKIRNNVQFDQAELEEIIKRLNEREKSYGQTEPALYQKHQQSEGHFLGEKNAFTDINNEDIVPKANLSIRHSRLALAYVQFICDAVLYENHKRALNEANEQKKMWQMQFDFYNDQMNRDQLWQTREKITKLIDSLTLSQKYDQFLFQSNFNLSLQNLKTKRDRSLGEIRDNLDAMITIIEETIAESSRKYTGEQQQYLLNLYSFKEVLDGDLNRFKHLFQLEEWGAGFALLVWNTVLWDGDGYAITVRKLAGALSIFLLGFVLSLWISRFFEKRLRVTSKGDETTSILFRHVIFYSLLCVFSIVALKTVRIPLTAFAFIGGTIGLGLGFGMQDVFANLISGIIIIGSRPFKLRDIIETESYKGIISEIKSRSTVILRPDGSEVMVPNSYFLKNSFINWTHKNSKNRIEIVLLTALRADPLEVEQLALSAVKANEKTSKNPAPWISMTHFNEIGCEYSLYFWLDIVQYNSTEVSGCIRAQIVSQLKERNWLSDSNIGHSSSSRAPFI